ncbi:MAG: YdeI/OmpD-associated family protein [Thermoplasmata archaeon]|nr:YdeI/OmpD-associated family protein [Thermoplasmata archaeon]
MAPSFRSRLTRPNVPGAWTFAEIPTAVIRAQELRPRMRVHGTLDGIPFRSALIPRGGGSLFVVVPQALRDQVGKDSGDPIAITLEIDARPDVVRVPVDFARALGSARARFDQLAPSHRKAFVLWVTGAKQAETRKRRTASAAAMVRRGETLN